KAAGRLAGYQVGAGHVCQPAQLGVEQGDVDELAFARAMAVLERGKYGDDGVHAGRDIDDGDTDLKGVALGRPGDAHQPTLSLDDRVVAGPVGIGTVLAIAGDGTVDKPRIQLAQGRVTQP